MKFIIDAQLPPSLAKLLEEKGHDAIHTISLPARNLTSDEVIVEISLKQKRIVVTKDTDFYHSMLLRSKPHKVLLIRLGNMRSKELKKIFMNNFRTILSVFRHNKLVELKKSGIQIIF